MNILPVTTRPTSCFIFPIEIHGILRHQLLFEFDFLISKRPQPTRHTDMTVVEIAEATGFTRPNHLFRTFRKRFGISPKFYQFQQKNLHSYAKQIFK
ncbi:MAG: helix-turn-helix domain-containing protein [Kiritimatiellaceae bacterium]|nr:helix-turn-helix domain-containing protein [Kiritimatiellaceae bacterium]